MAISDLRLFSSAGGNDITVTPGESAAPSVLPIFYANTLAASPNDIIVWAAGDGAAQNLGATLTGKVATTSSGILIPSRLDTLLVTATSGVLTPSINKAFIGQAATAAQGALTPAISTALVGQAATATQTSVDIPGYVALAGFRATASNGRFTEYYLLDTFTGTNNTLATSHVPEVPGGGGNVWALNFAGTTTPKINSNRLRPVDSSTYVVIDTNNFAVSKTIDKYVEASMYYAQASGNTGEFLLLDTATDSGYYFGWDDAAQQWDIGYRFSGAHTSLGVVGDTQTVGVSRTVRLELAYDNATPSNGVGLQGYVDGVLVLDTSDAFNHLTNSGYVGIATGTSAQGAGENHSFEFDWIRAGPVTRTLVGQAATATQTSVNIPGYAALIGLAATGTRGALTPNFDKALVGQSATGSVGTITPNTVNPGVTLTGIQAIASAFKLGYVNGADTWVPLGPAILNTPQGVLFPAFGVGSYTGFTSSVTPKIVVTTQAVGSGAQTYFVPKTAALPALGVLSEVAATATQNGFGVRIENAPGLGTGLNQVAQPTGTWTGAGAGSLPLLFSVGQDGNYQSTTTPIVGADPFVVRYNIYGVPDITPMGVYASGSNSSVMFYPKKFRPGPVNPQSSIVAWPVAVSPNDITVTPPLCVSAFTMLDGQRATLVPANPPSVATVAPAISYPGTTWVQLTGQIGTISTGVIGQGQVQLPTYPDTLAGRAETAQGVLTPTGANRSAALGDPFYSGPGIVTAAAGIIVPSVWDVLVAPAFVVKRAHTTHWSEEFFSPDFTGQDAVFATDKWSFTAYNAQIPDMQGIVVTPTGYGNVVYVSYLSHERQPRAVDGLLVDTDRQDYCMGLMVLDAITGRIYSNTLYRPPLVYEELRVRGMRFVSEVFKLSTGVSVTQYAHYGIVNLQWTAETVLTPSVAFKHSPPRHFGGAPLFIPSSSATDFWEEVTSRGDMVQHRLVHNAYISEVWVNDVTDPNSQWVLTYTTNTGGTASTAPWGDSVNIIQTADSFVPSTTIVSYNLGGGFGGNKPAFGFIGYQREQANVNSIDLGHSVAWFDHWNGLNPLFSVQAVGRVGQVSVNVGPVVALFGLRATTSSGPDSPFPMKDGDAHVWVVGRAATARAGWITPPAVTFLLDLFDDTDGTLLTAHLSDSGSMWAGSVKTQILNNRAAPTWTAGTADSALTYALQQAPTPDYRVTFHMAPTYSGTHLGNIPETGVVVRYNPADGSGYLFGYNGAEEDAYLFKLGPGAGIVSRGNIGFVSSTDVFAIEISGHNPPRLTCYINGVVWADGYETGLPAISDAGYVATRLVGFSALPGPLLDINGVYFDPSLCLLSGYRLNTSLGVLTGPWPTGQRAFTAIGVLTPNQPTNVTQALTGLGLTVAQGVIYTIPGTGILSGNSATASQGVLTPSITGNNTYAGLVGIQLVVSQGFLGMGQSLLPGQTATTTNGILGIVIDCFPAAVGLRLNTAQGVLTPNTSKALIGQSGAATSGVASPLVSVVLTGARTTTSAGTVTKLYEVFVTLTGNSATCVQSALTPVTTEGATAAGQVASGSVGVLKPNIVVTLFGAGAVSSAGVVSISMSCVLTGVASAATQNAVIALVSKLLTGASVTATKGLVGFTYDCRIDATGVQMRLYLTGMGTNAPVPKPDVMLWARTEVEKLFVQETPDEEFPVIGVNQ